MGYFGITRIKQQETSMNSDANWQGQAQQFQQELPQRWMQALQSFQQAGEGAGALPGLGFSADKLKSLQEAYCREATELWNQGLHANPATTDKRFASDAWSRNPVAAFSAAIYLLNAR